MSPIATEVERLTKQLSLMMMSRPELAMEVPLQIHSRGVDDGHGLGSPPFHPAFLAYLADGGVCNCEKRTDLGDIIHYCSSKPRRYQDSDHRNHPRRLQRVLRKLREINPVEFDIVYLMLGRGMSYDETMTRINVSRVASGRDAFTTQEFACLAIAGLDKTVSMF